MAVGQRQKITIRGGNMGLKFFRSYFIMGVPSKLGMGEALQGFMDIEQLLNFQNQIDRGNPFKKVLNIFFKQSIPVQVSAAQK